MGNTINIILALWISGLLSMAAIFLCNFLLSKTKNKNLETFFIWAVQAVHWTEANFSINTVKKEEAKKFIIERLKANNLTKNFSEEQIEAVIEWAVTQMRKNEVK
jgi:LL-H family phage holin